MIIRSWSFADYHSLINMRFITTRSLIRAHWDWIPAQMQHQRVYISQWLAKRARERKKPCCVQMHFLTNISGTKEAKERGMCAHAYGLRHSSEYTQTVLIRQLANLQAQVAYGRVRHATCLSEEWMTTRLFRHGRCEHVRTVSCARDCTYLIIS